jgi:hypothetical protein
LHLFLFPQHFQERFGGAGHIWKQAYRKIQTKPKKSYPSIKAQTNTGNEKKKQIGRDATPTSLT